MLKFSWVGLLRLRPFSEQEESSAENEFLHQKPVVLVLNLAGLLFVITDLLSLLFGNSQSQIRHSLLAVGCVAIVAGIYWNAGFKAKSLNQLFMAVLYAALFVLTIQMLEHVELS